MYHTSKGEYSMKHIVFFKLKECTKENQQTFMDILNKMDGKIDYVEKIETGIDFLHSDRSFDVVLMVTLPKDKLDTYANDPLHCACKKEFSNLLEKSVTVDVE